MRESAGADPREGHVTRRVVARRCRRNRAHRGQTDGPADLPARVDQTGSDARVRALDTGQTGDRHRHERARQADAADDERGKHVAEVAAVGRKPGEQRQRRGRHDEPARQHRADAEPRHEHLCHVRHDDDGERDRREGDARLDGRIAENVLQVQRQQEELREPDGRDQYRGCIGGGQRAQAEDLQRQERPPRPGFDHDEADEQHRRRGEQPDSGGRRPPGGRRVRHRVDEEHDCGGHRDRSRHIEVTMRHVEPALPQEQRRRGYDDGGDGEVDEEDPRPAEVGRQHPAEQDACGAAAPGRCSPDAEGDVALSPLRKDRHQDRQRSGREQRAAEPLEGAKRDQRPFRPGETGEQ